MAAFKAREHWLRVEWLPKYAPELNDIEVVWGDLKAHQTFTDPEELDRAIHDAVEKLNTERVAGDSLVKFQISAWLFVLIKMPGCDGLTICVKGF